MLAIKTAIKHFKSKFSSLDWEADNGFFPTPNLKENKIYAVRDASGNNSIAKFCFGQGEYWWINPDTNKEVSVSQFHR